MATIVPELKFEFMIEVLVGQPVVIGNSSDEGRRQLIPIINGTINGAFTGEVLAGGIDSQIIHTNGVTEVSARYGIQLDDGRTFYIQNDGIRRVPIDYIDEVLNGKIIDSNETYFVTVPRFEVYDNSLSWLKNYIFICQAKRLTGKVILNYYRVISGKNI